VTHLALNLILNNFTLSVVSHGQARMVEGLLSQLDEHSSLRGVKVIVTLNLDEEFNIESYRNIQIFMIRNSSPKGFGANHNKAFEYCTTPWFGVLNPDLRLTEEEPFTKLLELYQSDAKDIGVIAPRIVNEHGSLEDSVRSNLTPWSVILRHFFGRRKSFALVEQKNAKSFFWMAGMCLLLNSAAFKSIKGFDERFFLYCEDYDLCARLYASGYLLKYIPNYSIVHQAQRDSHRSLRHLYWHLSSLAKVWVSKSFWTVTLFD
jgi:N-acetylglucosaminyl-diphospho-decaprenol L-rhamnosyltransferase